MTDEPRRITLPMDEATARSLRAGDLVVLDGEVVLCAGLPTVARLIECLDGTRPLPRPMAGAAVLHLGSFSQEGVDGGFEVLYMNPTTSTRFNAVMPRVIEGFGLRAVGGKGGLDSGCAAAMQRAGCVYLSFPGGAAPLLSDAIREVVSVQWEDLVSHYRLVTLRVEGLGPAVVGIDAHGGSLYGTLQEQAEARLPAIMAQLAQERGA